MVLAFVLACVLSSPTMPAGMNRRGWLLLLTFCLAVFVFRAATSAHSPVTWDEPVYLNASRAYVNWVKDVIQHWSHGRFLEPFSAEAIDQYWQRHLPSPPLAKIINGVCGMVFQPLFGELAALRSGSALLYAILFGLVVLHLVRLQQVPEVPQDFLIPTIVAAGALLINPRLFSHAGTANLDTIGMVFTYLSLYWFWKTSEQTGWKATVVCGLLWGCAFAAKNTAVLALPVFVAWMLLWARKKHLVVRFILMQGIAAIVFLLVWPWLWHDTAARLGEFSRWAGFTGIVDRVTGPVAATDGKLEREFGLSSSGLIVDGEKQFPWHYSFDVMAVVMPLPTLLVFVAANVLFLWRDRARGAIGFVVLGAWMPVVLTMFTPVYDMERFLLLSMPFMAVLCGYAAARATSGMSSGWRMAAILILLSGYVPAVLEWSRVHPYEFSFFNAAAGRLPGAVEKGFARSYWLQPLHGALPFINERLPEGASLACEERGVLEIYQEFHMLRTDLVPCKITNAVTAGRCDYLLRREPVKEERKQALQTLYTFSMEGVPLASVFRITEDYVQLLRQRDEEALKLKLQRQEQEMSAHPPAKRPPAAPRKKRRHRPR